MIENIGLIIYLDHMDLTDIKEHSMQQQISHFSQAHMQHSPGISCVKSQNKS